MKKYNSIFAIAVVSLLAACSSEDELAQNGDLLTPEQQVDLIDNSDVVIRLNGGSSRSAISRASISNIEGTTGDDGYGLFEIPKDGKNFLGIFCLASTQKDPTSGLDIDWSKTWNPFNSKDFKWESSATDKWSVWMGNVKAWAEAVDIDNDDRLDETQIHWSDGYNRYYPTGNYHTYSFYGYYPRQVVSDARFPAALQSSSKITAHYNIKGGHLDGTQDVIWGKSHPTQAELSEGAYCANYFHSAQRETPAIQFEHKFMRLDFEIVPGGEYDGAGGLDYSRALATKVKSISITNVPDVVDLVIADKENPANEGKLTVDTSSRTTAFTLKETNEDGEDQTLTPTAPQMGEGEDGQDVPVFTPIGQGILLPVIGEDDDPYTMQMIVTFTDTYIGEDQNPVEREVEMSLPVPLNLKQNVAYEEGKYYTVKITIFSPTLIKVNATLKDWVKGDPEDGETFEDQYGKPITFE